MDKRIPYLVNIVAVIICLLVGLSCLSDGKMWNAGFQFSLALVNSAVIVWLYRRKDL